MHRARTLPVPGLRLNVVLYMLVNSCLCFLQRELLEEVLKKREKLHVGTFFADCQAAFTSLAKTMALPPFKSPRRNISDLNYIIFYIHNS